MSNIRSKETEGFIHRWRQSSASERANYAPFLSELCDFLDLPRPDPSQADEDANTYVIDKAVVFQNLDGSSTTNFIDFHKRNCFVLEAKQGSNPQPEQNGLPFALVPPQAPRRKKRGTAVRGTHGWDAAMLGARGQAERYAKALPASEGWPPFLIVVDVGHSIELFADFSLTGKAYLPFPGPRNFRILLHELEQSEMDAHRKRQQALAPWLTLTEMYNVLEKLKSNEELTAEERATYDAGLVGILRELHEEQDAAGAIRWLRPEFQAPNELAVQAAFAGLAPWEQPPPRGASSPGRSPSLSRSGPSRAPFERRPCRRSSRSHPDSGRPAGRAWRKFSRR
ncbi:MAG: type IIL restriction-modification enzyme MmeI [Terracidiphilus sp.]|jgi:hypothetical protein